MLYTFIVVKNIMHLCYYKCNKLQQHKLGNEILRAENSAETLTINNWYEVNFQL